jgi:hypothetical protein
LSILIAVKPHAGESIVPEAGHMVYYSTADAIVKAAEVVRVEAGP